MIIPPDDPRGMTTPEKSPQEKWMDRFRKQFRKDDKGCLFEFLYSKEVVIFIEKEFETMRLAHEKLVDSSYDRGEADKLTAYYKAKIEKLERVVEVVRKLADGTSDDLKELREALAQMEKGDK